MQLQIGSVASRLRHGANDAGQLGGRPGAEQTGEDIAQRWGMVQVVQDDHRWQLRDAIRNGSLLGNVAKILPQILWGLVVHAAGRARRGIKEVHVKCTLE